MPKHGFRMPDAAKEKMRAAKVGKKTGPHSEERKAKISAANRGKKREKKHAKTCRCGQVFLTSSPFARFCSERCKKAARGHGLRHAPEYQHFPKACAICGSCHELVGDHDHATGAPRGILCRKCNLALGNMEDSVERLLAAAAYLSKSRGRQGDCVYVSGPMSGLPLLNFPAFHRAAASLRASGYTVINPAELDELGPAEGMTWEQYLRRDIKALMDCTHVALLPGWENSRGARLEKHIADALGMRPIFINDSGAAAQSPPVARHSV